MLLMNNEKIPKFHHATRFLDFENHVNGHIIQIKSSIKGVIGTEHCTGLIPLGIDSNSGERIYIGNNLSSKPLSPIPSVQIKTLPNPNTNYNEHFIISNIMFRQSQIDMKPYTPTNGSFKGFFKNIASPSLITNQFLTTEMCLHEPVNHLELPNQRTIRGDYDKSSLYETITIKTRNLGENLLTQNIIINPELKGVLDDSIYNEEVMYHIEGLTTFDQKLMYMESIMRSDPGFFQGKVDWVKFNSGVDKDGV